MMVFKALRDCKWSINSDTYSLEKDKEINIKDEHITQAKASKLFFDVILKDDDVIKPNKRKTNTKPTTTK